LGLLPPQADGAEPILQSTSRATVGLVTRRITSLIRPTAGGRVRSQEKNTDVSDSGFQGGPREFVSGGFTGISGGDAVNKYSVWTNGAFSWLEGKNRVTDYTGYSRAALAGFDYVFQNDLVVGLTASYDNSNLSMIGNRSLKVAGLGLLPYAGLSLFDNAVSIEAIGGYFTTETESHSLIEQASYDGDRWLAALSAAYYHQIGNLMISPTVGTSYARSRDDSFVTTAGMRYDGIDVHVLDVKGGVDAVYTVTDSVELGGTVTYIRDLVPGLTENTIARQTDPDLVELRARVGWYAADNMTVSAEVSHNLFTRDQKATTLIGNLRVAF
jgi:outer membrane autotransporter protein